MQAIRQSAWGGTETMALAEAARPATARPGFSRATRCPACRGHLAPGRRVLVAGVDEAVDHTTAEARDVDVVVQMSADPGPGRAGLAALAGLVADKRLMHVDAVSFGHPDVVSEPIAFRVVASGRDEVTRQNTALPRTFPDHGVKLECLIESGVAGTARPGVRAMGRAFAGGRVRVGEVAG